MTGIDRNTIDRNTILLSLVVALGVALVAGLVVIPAIHEAQARSLTAVLRDKGQQGDDASGGKRQGGGGCGSTC
jgi:hypothetical protein